MDFSFTEEQSMLRDTVASYLADHYAFDQRRAILAKEPGWSPAIWIPLFVIGVCAISLYLARTYDPAARRYLKDVFFKRRTVAAPVAQGSP